MATWRGVTTASTPLGMASSCSVPAKEMLSGLPEERLKSWHLERHKAYLLLTSDHEEPIAFKAKAKLLGWTFQKPLNAGGSAQERL